MSPARLLCALLGAALLPACPAPSPAADAGSEPDAAAPPPCDSPEDCRVAGFDGVCRGSVCRSDVPCADDLECGLGERCLSARCRFTGCVEDSDCSTGRCRADVFACAECGKSSDCPRDRPVCEPKVGTCVQCTQSAECDGQGAPYCEPSSGSCVYCLVSDHCPNGLSCGADGRCHGAREGMNCSEDVLCDLGLLCVTAGVDTTCRRGCGLYTPSCREGEICLKLTFTDSNSLVFDKGEPQGICSAPFQGLKGYRETCARSVSGDNCQPNLMCVPSGPLAAACRTFCDPLATSCPPGELCHAFPGDYLGHQYGLCYPDTGWGERCAKDSTCRQGMACRPGDDPSTFEELATFCDYAVGAAPALSPCANQQLPDGGPVSPDSVCASGYCRGDSTMQTANFFCYGACEKDEDCAVGGREGTCDATFTFTGRNNVTGTLKGCRPSCASPEGCGEYGLGLTCRPRVQLSLSVPRLVQACGPPVGAGLLGEPCAIGADCRSGYCVREDGRGVARSGYCAHPCAAASDCAAGDGLDGGTPGARTGPLECRQVALLGHRGPDGLPNTSDDKHVVARHCAGRTCATDADCAPDGRCVPEPDPADPLGALVLRCRPPHPSGALPGAASCTADAECESGACVELQPPSSASGRVCLMACDGSTSCPGGTSCRVGGARLLTANGSSHNLDACAP